MSRSDEGTMRVLVLGGAGFIGRHAVDRLLAGGALVTIASRDPRRIGRRLPTRALACRRIPLRFETMVSPADWEPTLASFDVVLNCVGILRERGAETYDLVHHVAPAALAGACLHADKRLVHLSALGLTDTARSGFLRSKFLGELALRGSGARVCIVRPSLLDGDGGFGARWLRCIARWPVHAFPVDATGKIAALDVVDLADALARLVLDADACRCSGAAEIELGGSALHTLPDLLAALRRRHTSRRAVRIAVPGWLARLASHICDLVHWSPFSFGHWELLRQDNRPHVNRLAELIGRPPRHVGEPEAIAGVATQLLPG